MGINGEIEKESRHCKDGRDKKNTASFQKENNLAMRYNE